MGALPPAARTRILRLPLPPTSYLPLAALHRERRDSSGSTVAVRHAGDSIPGRASIVAHTLCCTYPTLFCRMILRKTPRVRATRRAHKTAVLPPYSCLFHIPLLYRAFRTTTTPPHLRHAITPHRACVCYNTTAAAFSTICRRGLAIYRLHRVLFVGRFWAYRRMPVHCMGGQHYRGSTGGG